MNIRIRECYCFWVTKVCPWHFCDVMDCSPPGSSVHGISQARILEWVAIAFSHHCPGHRHLPNNPGTEPASPALADRFFTAESSGKAKNNRIVFIKTTHGDLLLKKILKSGSNDIYKGWWVFLFHGTIIWQCCKQDLQSTCWNALCTSPAWPVPASPSPDSP